MRRPGRRRQRRDPGPDPNGVGLWAMLPPNTAAETISGVLTDLGEVADQLASGQPVSGFTVERNARILDRLAEEIAEAASPLRSAG